MKNADDVLCGMHPISAICWAGHREVYPFSLIPAIVIVARYPPYTYVKDLEVEVFSEQSIALLLQKRWGN